MKYTLIAILLMFSNNIYSQIDFDSLYQKYKDKDGEEITIMSNYEEYVANVRVSYGSDGITPTKILVYSSHPKRTVITDIILNYCRKLHNSGYSNDKNLESNNLFNYFVHEYDFGLRSFTRTLVFIKGDDIKKVSYSKSSQSIDLMGNLRDGESFSFSFEAMSKTNLNKFTEDFSF